MTYSAATQAPKTVQNFSARVHAAPNDTSVFRVHAARRHHATMETRCFLLAQCAVTWVRICCTGHICFYRVHEIGQHRVCLFSKKYRTIFVCSHFVYLKCVVKTTTQRQTPNKSHSKGEFLKMNERKKRKKTEREGRWRMIFERHAFENVKAN